MSIRTKLICAFGIVTLITLSVSILGFLQTRKLGSALYEIAVVRLPSIDGLNQIRAAMVELNSLAAARLNFPETAAENSLREKEALKRLQAGWDLYEPLPQTEEEAAKWKAFVVAVNRWKSLRGPEDAAKAESFSTALRLLDEVIAINDRIVNGQKMRTVASFEDSVRIQRQMLFASVLALAIAVGIGIYLGRGIARPLAAVTRSLAKIGKGNLQTHIETNSKDELGEVARATNRLAQELSMSEARLKSLSDNLPADMVYQLELQPDGKTRFTYVSAGVERLHGISAQDLVRNPNAISEQIVEEDRPNLRRSREQSASTMTPFDAVVRVRRKDGEIRWMHLCSAPRRLRDGRIIWDGVERDITERKQADERIELLQTITADIAKAEDLQSAFKVVLQRLCEKTGWLLGHAWVVDPDGKHLRMTAGWVCVESSKLEEFSRSSQDVKLKRGVSLPGMVLESCEPAWVPDLTKHPLFPESARRDAAIEAGIRAALAVPIVSDQQVIAVLEFGMTDARAEDQRLTELIFTIATQIGLVIQRKRAAREIHDILAQELTRLRIDLGWIQKRVAAARPTENSAGLLERLESVINLTHSATVTVQKIATELRPVVLDSLGLAAAIEWQAEEVQQRTGLQCDVIISESGLRMDHATETNIFRIVQESLTNVVRHAKATRIEIIFERNGDDMVLMIQDNGVGFDPANLSDPNSLGLLGMRERALLIDGKFEIAGQPGKGTQAKLTFPLKEPLREEVSKEGPP